MTADDYRNAPRRRDIAMTEIRAAIRRAGERRLAKDEPLDEGRDQPASEPEAGNGCAEDDL